MLICKHAKYKNVKNCFYPIGTNALMCMITGSFILEYLARQSNEINEYSTNKLFIFSARSNSTAVTNTNSWVVENDLYINESNKIFEFSDAHYKSSNPITNSAQLHNNIEYVTSLCLLTGVWQVILSALKFGKLSWLLSEIVLSAFVSAAAFHILTSQVKSLFGLTIERSPKLFGIIYVSEIIVCQSK